MSSRQMMFGASAVLAIASAWSVAAAQETINFEGLQPGTIVDQVLSDMGSGPIGVLGSNPLLPGENAAGVFNSAQPTGDDCDLGTPNKAFGGPGCGRKAAAGPNANDVALHNLLILDTDLDPIDGGSGLVTNPDDLDCSNMFDGQCAGVPNANATISFDFVELGSVTLVSLTLIDADGVGPNARVELYDEDLNVLHVVLLPTNNPDNGVALVDLGDTPGVRGMTVFLQGSGAIDEIVFLQEDGDDEDGDEDGDDEDGDEDEDVDG